VAATLLRSNPTLASTKYALELDGQAVGTVVDFDGGDATGDVVTEQPGADGLRHKHLAGVKYEDISITCHADMPAPVRDWITGTLTRNYIKHEGAVIGLGINDQQTSRLEFSRAMIRRITFPALDASSKDTALIRVTLAPEVTRLQPKGGQVAFADSDPKSLLARNFRLQIDGLDCNKVESIESLTVEYDLASGTEFRDAKIAAPVQNVPNLAFTIAQSGADALVAWHKDFVINGNRSAQNEKQGTLQFLAANMKDAPLTLAFQNLGIFRLRQVNDRGSIARLRAEMYCEAIAIAAGTSQPVLAYEIGQTNQSQSDNNARPQPRGVTGLSLTSPAASKLAIAPPSPPRSPEQMISTLKFRS
jgi:hypothetical protein